MLRRNRNYNNPINENNEENVAVAKENPLIDTDALQKMEDIIEKTAAFTKEALNKRKKAKPVAEKYKFMEIDGDEMMNEEVEKQYSSSPDYIKNGTMKDYQVEGLNWLLSLHSRNMNGILADEMGLGKTIQTISLLGHLKNKTKENEPHLVIVPKSTVRNWENEIKKFCPSLSYFVLIGQKDARKELIADNFKGKTFGYDVLITSFDMVLRETAVFKKIKFNYIVIDEAHRIKNLETRLALIVRQLKVNHRLLITGTPLQNNLEELWALLNFLLPSFFGSKEEFTEIFDEEKIVSEDVESVEIETNESPESKVEISTEDQPSPKADIHTLKKSELVLKLRAIIKPLFLRRLKSDAEKSIPPKNEIFLYAELTKLQRDLYKSLLIKDISALKNNTMAKLSNVVIQTRKCCSHPYLFEGVEEGPPYTTDQHIVDCCGKMLVLDKLIDRLRADGHRGLIFCQFIKTLDILEDYLIWKNLEYFRLDGDTELDLRQEMIDKYNDPKNFSKYFLFLISTRAGGLGINLATADTVIFYDSDWNPQVDLQATDRAHRIGQLKTVNVYRIITQCTIEERVLARAAYKLNLNRYVIKNQNEDDSNRALVLSKDDAIATLNRGLDYIIRAESREDQQKPFDIDSLIEKSKQIREGSIKQLDFTKESIELNKQQFQENLKKLAMTDFNSYEFEGQNFRVMKAESIKNKWMLNNQATGRRVPQKPLKEVHLEKFRFYPPGLANLIEREAYAYKKLINYQPMIEDQGNPQLAIRLFNAEREKIRNAIPLTKNEQEEKNQGLKQGFINWTSTEYKLLLTAMRKFGRSDFVNISKFLQTKNVEEVKEYLKVFWNRVHELPDSNSIVASIQKSEDENRRRKEFEEFLDKKFQHIKDPLTEINIYYYDSSNMNKFSRDEDKIIIWLFYKYKSLYLNSDNNKAENCTMESKLFERIRDDIKFIPNFRFNWRFLSCNANMLNQRCKYLLKLIQKESLNINFKSPQLEFMISENDEDDTGIFYFNVNDDNGDGHKDNNLTREMSDCLIEEINDTKNDTVDYEQEKASSSSDSSYASDASADFKIKKTKVNKIQQKSNTAVVKNKQQQQQPQKSNSLSQKQTHAQKNEPKAKVKHAPLFFVVDSDDDLPML